MLDSPDTEVVKLWLASALEAGADRQLTKSGLAEHCGVSPQAVSGWLRTGRISKSSIARAADYLGSAPSFGPQTHRTLRTEEPAASYAGMTSQEVDLLIAFRSLPKALQRARYDQLMADAEDVQKFASSVLAREGVNGRISNARAAQFLPPSPAGDQADTVPGELESTAHKIKR